MPKCLICGDNIIIINAKEVLLTGNKLEGKKYYNHSRYAGGLRTRTAKEMVEIEFENLLEWQIKDNQSDILDVSMFFNEKNLIVWMDDIYTRAEDMKKGSYVIAESMKWRITK